MESLKKWLKIENTRPNQSELEFTFSFDRKNASIKSNATLNTKEASNSFRKVPIYAFIPNPFRYVLSPYIWFFCRL